MHLKDYLPGSTVKIRHNEEVVSALIIRQDNTYFGKYDVLVGWKDTDKTFNHYCVASNCGSKPIEDLLAQHNCTKYLWLIDITNSSEYLLEENDDCPETARDPSQPKKENIPDWKRFRDATRSSGECPCGGTWGVCLYHS